jgi:WD40 repeat protein
MIILSIDDCLSEKIENDSKFTILAIDWNADDSMLVGCCGNSTEKGFCADSEGALVIWRLESEPKDNQYTIYKVITHHSSLTCVATHPTLPNIIAAGSYYGEILVFDTTKDEPIKFVSDISLKSHAVKVTDILWNRNNFNKDWTLWSLGIDGKLLIWNINNVEKPLIGFKFQQDEDNSFGCTRMIISGVDYDKVRLVVGSDCGALIKGTLKQESFSDKEYLTSPHKKTIHGMIDETFKAVEYSSITERVDRIHDGRIISIDISHDFTRYLSCGCDGVLNIYDDSDEDHIPNEISLTSTGVARFSSFSTKVNITIERLLHMTFIIENITHSSIVLFYYLSDYCLC